MATKPAVPANACPRKPQRNSHLGALKAPNCTTQIISTYAFTSLSPNDYDTHTKPILYAKDLAITTTRGAQPTLVDERYLPRRGV